MKHRVSLTAVICLTGIALLSEAGLARSEGSLATDTSTPGEIGKVASVPPKSDAVSQTPALPPGSAMSLQTVRDVPSISGHYSIGRTTVMPYLGVGFGGGYTSDVDRSMSNGMSPSSDPGLRNLLGQSLTPNEFRMGIRIPF